jgi:hypothetical protein
MSRQRPAMMDNGTGEVSNGVRDMVCMMEMRRIAVMKNCPANRTHDKLQSHSGRDIPCRSDKYNH